MLVLISGVIATGKNLIARQIISPTNTFTISGYSLDLTNTSLGTLVDSEGNTTTIGRLIADGIILDDSEEARALYELDYNFQQHEIKTRLKHNFQSAGYDATVLRVPIPEGQTLTIPWEKEGEYTSTNALTVGDVVANYNESSIRPYVINGIFGKAFVDRMKTELGAENVLVYNIIRNPSVVFALTSSERSNGDIGPNEEERLYISLLQSALLKDVEGVITVKFEDMIENQEFIYNGSNVGVFSGWVNDNGLITTYERENVVSSINVSESDMSNFNTVIQSLDYNTTEMGINEVDNELVEQVGTWNIFTELGYEPKTLAEITSS